MPPPGGIFLCAPRCRNRLARPPIAARTAACPMGRRTLMPTLQAISTRLARAEAALAGAMIAAVLAITGIGAIARYFGAPLLWADEAAIAAMIWSAFLGASALFASRGHMAIELLSERLGPGGLRGLSLAADLVVLAAALGLCALLWRWFDLPGLIRTGSAEALADESFNYIYLEPTQTLGIRKVWIWLVLPVFALGSAIHAAALVAGDLRALRRQA
ncbi:TRAP transporter small permease [Sinirhodobacter populi]|uniref:TRAP transporter small permease protein n=2 Tax=Paenirhodobacter populi TaxID=2306993 RepID=A0A443KHL5_9RHOB|nr:TRAP transporter small permease [Sinirhodobacter populi]